jgi:hypothetical protein
LKELIIVVPDLPIQETVKALLTKRYRTLGIKELKEKEDFVIEKPLNNDSGCRIAVENGLQELQNKFAHVLVIFDKYGCGWETIPSSEIEETLEKSLIRNGWEKNQIAIVVIEPEIEIWVWGDWKKLETILGWEADRQGVELKNWLVNENLLKPEAKKPDNPEEALERVLTKIRRRKVKKLESATFGELAEKINFKDCEDRAFNKLREVVYKWFREE